MSQTHPNSLSAADRQMTLWPAAKVAESSGLPPYHRDVSTSRAAAEAAATRQPGRRARIVAYIVNCGRRGATRDDIAAALDLPIQCVCGPVRDLLDAGEIHETAETRPTRLLGEVSRLADGTYSWVIFGGQGQGECPTMRDARRAVEQQVIVR